MQVGSAEDHGFFVAERVQLLHQLFADHPVEVLVDHAAIEGIHLETEFIFQLGGALLPAGMNQPSKPDWIRDLVTSVHRGSTSLTRARRVDEVIHASSF